MSFDDWEERNIGESILDRIGNLGDIVRGTGRQLGII
jgi:hypothetical protein